MKDCNIIKCSHCGAEYIPSEIFYSDDFLESDVHVLKDKHGRIQHINCKDADLYETYCCDICGKTFEDTVYIY